MPPKITDPGFKDSRKRSNKAQTDMNKKVSKWGKSSTKRQASGLASQAASNKASDKKPKTKRGK